jgi:hypothetical protein
MHWNGWIENSRFFLTRAIVDEDRFEIDSFANQTSDRAFFNNHYYTDKDPGTSFIAVIPYSVFKILFESSLRSLNEKQIPIYLPSIVNGVPIYDVLNPDRFTLYSMIIVTTFSSVLLSSLTVVLIYKTTGFFTKRQTDRLLITLAAGIASAIFPFALVFTDNAPSVFFAFLGFYILLKKKYERVDQKKYSLLAGLSLGLSVLTTTQAIVILILSVFYVKKLKNSELKFLILGSLITLSIYPIYNFIVFKNPFLLPKNYLDTAIFGITKIGGPTSVLSLQGVAIQVIDVLGSLAPNPPIVWHLLFDTYKGLFFYYPFLILSFYGLYVMYKKRGLVFETIFIILTFYFILNINSNAIMWWGGGYFGPRLLTLIFPFLLIPLIFVLQEKSKKSKIIKPIKLLLIALIAYSTVVNFAGIMHPAQEIIGPDLVSVDLKYASKINSFEFLTNPILDYYLPEFIKSGSRSRIVDTAFNCDGLIDIREPLPIYAQNCSIPIVASGEASFPQNMSLKLCVCSQYSGGDGAIFDIRIGNRKDSVFLPSNSCMTKIWQAPYGDNEEHQFVIKGGVSGNCDKEGVLIREMNFINETVGTGKFPLNTFDFRNILLEVWNYSGNARYTTNGIELGVGNCDSTSSLQKSIAIPKNARTMNVRACADFAGGDGTMIKVYVDNEANIFEIPSNLCLENNFGIGKFADGKEHMIRIESQIKGSCLNEGPKISWVKIFD